MLLESADGVRWWRSLLSNNHHALAALFSYRSSGDGIIGICVKAEAYELLVSVIRAGAHPNEFQDYGMSALSLAAHLNDNSAVVILLRHGACPDGLPDEEHCPLFYAVDSNNLAVAMSLLSCGSDPMYRPANEGKYCIDVAKSQEMFSMITLYSKNVKRHPSTDK